MEAAFRSGFHGEHRVCSRSTIPMDRDPFVVIFQAKNWKYRVEHKERSLEPMDIGNIHTKFLLYIVGALRGKIISSFIPTFYGAKVKVAAVIDSFCSIDQISYDIQSVSCFGISRKRAADNFRLTLVYMND